MSPQCRHNVEHMSNTCLLCRIYVCYMIFSVKRNYLSFWCLRFTDWNSCWRDLAPKAAWPPSGTIIKHFLIWHCQFAIWQLYITAMQQTFLYWRPFFPENFLTMYQKLCWLSAMNLIVDSVMHVVADFYSATPIKLYKHTVSKEQTHMR